MKTKKTILTALTIGLLAFSSSAQNVGINGSGANAHQSAALDVSSTNTGLLIPRVTDTTTVNSAATAGSYALAEGLMIYDLTDHCIRLYDGTAWSSCVAGNANVGYPVGYVHCGSPTDIVDVTSPTTGRVWMDRNLGALSVANGPNDVLSFGSYFQWGRGADGHQCRNGSFSSSFTSSSDIVPAPYADSILAVVNSTTPYDWRVPFNNSLWQGVNGINNPCPIGYYVPSLVEWQAEFSTFSSGTASYLTIPAYSSFLKIASSGTHAISPSYATYSEIGTHANFWTSTVAFSLGTNRSRYIRIAPTTRGNVIYSRYALQSVRCIKD